MIRRPDDRQRFVTVQRLVVASSVSVLPLLALVVPPSAATAQTQSTDTAAAAHAESGPHSDTFETWLLLAIDGDAEAQFNLGLLYSEGKGVQIDYKQAAYWYSKGAEQGHTGAQYNLAHLYLDGYGVAKDPVKAAHWWRQAAGRGHILAQQHLGYAYFKGIGVAKDEVQAVRWFREAAKGGDPRAKKMLATMERQQLRGAPDGERMHPSTPKVADEDVAPPTERASTETGSHARADAPALLGPHDNPNPAVASGDNSGRRPADAHTDADSRSGLYATAEVSPKAADLVTAHRPMEAKSTAANVDGAPEPAKAAHDRRRAQIPDKATESARSSTAETAESAPQSESAAIDAAETASLSRNEDAPPPTSMKTAAPEKTSVELTPQLLANLNQPDRIALPPIPTADDSVGENETWLFKQPTNFFTLQLISAPSLYTVKKFWRDTGLADAKLLGTQIDGRRWWYLLYGSYPSIDAARAGASMLGLAQTDVWIRRFGALQQNRCNNLATTDSRLSDYCGSAKTGAAHTKSGDGLELNGYDHPGRSAFTASHPATTKRAGTARKRRLPVLAEPEAEYSQLRRDDHAWLFSQPGDYYTVQLISVPNISQVARFLRANQLQHEAVSFTTRRDENDWFIALYGSHSNLKAATQATKSLPVSSGTVWIRQFTSIQKRQCRIANQLPGSLSDSVNYYCRP